MGHAVTNGATRRARTSHRSLNSSEVRFRGKGTGQEFRSATILAGNDALELARKIAREFATTYGDLEFAIFSGGELVEEVRGS